MQLRWREGKKEQQGGISLYKFPVERRSWEMQQKNVDCRQRVELGLGVWVAGSHKRSPGGSSYPRSSKHPGVFRDDAQVKDTAPPAQPTFDLFQRPLVSTGNRNILIVLHCTSTKTLNSSLPLKLTLGSCFQKDVFNQVRGRENASSRAILEQLPCPRFPVFHLLFLMAESEVQCDSLNLL